MEVEAMDNVEVVSVAEDITMSLMQTRTKKTIQERIKLKQFYLWKFSHYALESLNKEQGEEVNLTQIDDDEELVLMMVVTS